MGHIPRAVFVIVVVVIILFPPNLEAHAKFCLSFFLIFFFQSLECVSFAGVGVFFCFCELQTLAALLCFPARMSWTAVAVATAAATGLQLQFSRIRVSSKQIYMGGPVRAEFINAVPTIGMYRCSLQLLTYAAVSELLTRTPVSGYIRCAVCHIEVRTSAMSWELTMPAGVWIKRLVRKIDSTILTIVVVLVLWHDVMPSDLWTKMTRVAGGPLASVCDSEQHSRIRINKLWCFNWSRNAKTNIIKKILAKIVRNSATISKGKEQQNVICISVVVGHSCAIQPWQR